MKELIFAAGFPTTVVVGTVLAMSFRKVQDLVFMAMVFGTVISDRLDINLTGRDWYRGTTRGIEVSFVDALVLIVLLSTFLAPRERSSNTPGGELSGPKWPPCLAIILAYFAYCCANVAFSDPKLFGVWELTKIVRAALVFLASARFVRGRREILLLLFALCLTVSFEAVYCLRDRYLLGYHRVGGTLGHPNALSMYSCMAAPLLIAAATSNAPGPFRLLCAFCAALAAGRACCFPSAGRDSRRWSW